jgi:hypothetical protein
VPEKVLGIRICTGLYNFLLIFLQGGLGMAKKKESLIVASKVKAYIKSKKMMTSSDALGAINDVVYAALDAAMERTKANRRSTVRAQDL